jgi:hypothetical protein
VDKAAMAEAEELAALEVAERIGALRVTSGETAELAGPVGMVGVAATGVLRSAERSSTPEP